MFGSTLIDNIEVSLAENDINVHMLLFNFYLFHKSDKGV